MSATWSGGYVADSPYLPTYLSAQAPPEMELVCALAGTHFGLPREGLTILDLGCGRGVALMALAAANPSWTAIGIDYMPSHVGEARDIAEAAGLDNARFLEIDLAALTEDEAKRVLPELDVVTMHGLWSWVSDSVREGVLRVLRSRLKPGGLVLVTYNALPGWSHDLALQRLLRDSVPLLEGSTPERMAAALDLARALHGAGAQAMQRGFFLDRIAKYGESSRDAFARYAVHEFLSAHWRPCWPQDVAASLSEAKLDFAGSASLALHLTGLGMTPEQQAAMAALPQGLDREFLRDLFAEPTLRQDLFIRGWRPAAPATTVPALRLALRRKPRDGRVALATPAGEAELPPAVIGAALAALERGPRSVGELAALPEMARTTPGELLAVLAGSHVAAPVWRTEVSEADQARARRFNQVLLQYLGAEATALGSDLAIAAPMLGAGLPSRPVEIATLLALHGARAAGQPVPPPAAIARGMLVAEPDAEAIAWTTEAVEQTLEQRFHAWRALGML